MNILSSNNRFHTRYSMWVIALLWLGLSISARGESTKIRIHKATVYVFLSDTCPICQVSTLTLRNLHEQYGKFGIRFIGVFPDNNLKIDDLMLFQKQYNIAFPLILDKNLILTRRFHANITPEVVVVNQNGIIQYQGRIDDNYLALGKKRINIQHHELQDALQAIIDSKPITIKYTEAIGCLISQ